jgi:hypothetical protein
MTPKLANEEAFSTKSTQYMRLERRKEAYIYNTALSTHK